MLPRLASGDAAADFGGRDFIQVHLYGKLLNAMSELPRDVEFTLARRHKQTEFLKHSAGEFRIAIVPAKNALSRIATAEEEHLRSGIVLVEFSRDVDEETFLGDSRGMGARRNAEHFQTLIERRAFHFLVREHARNDADNLISERLRSLSQCKVGNSDGVEGPRQNGNSFRGLRQDLVSASAVSEGIDRSQISSMCA